MTDPNDRETLLRIARDAIVAHVAGAQWTSAFPAISAGAAAASS